MPSAKWPWPDALDALLAAPEFHVLLFENERVRVLDTRIPPGRTVPIHTHRWPSIYYIRSAGEFVRHDAQGNVLVDTRSLARPADPPVVLWSEPLPPHSLENVGITEIHVVSVELKDELPS